VPVWMSVHRADGFVEGGGMGDFPCNALDQQRLDFTRGQAVHAGEEVVRRIVEEPGAA